MDTSAKVEAFTHQFLLHRPRRMILQQFRHHSGPRSVPKDSFDWNRRDREGYSRLLKYHVYLYLLLKTNRLTFLLGGYTWSYRCWSSHCLRLSFSLLLSHTTFFLMRAKTATFILCITTVIPFYMLQILCGERLFETFKHSNDKKTSTGNYFCHGRFELKK